MDHQYHSYASKILKHTLRENQVGEKENQVGKKRNQVGKMKRESKCKEAEKIHKHHRNVLKKL